MVMAEAAKVIVYSTPWCAFCKTEKQYLDHLGVAFVDKDIENDTAAFDELAQKTDISVSEHVRLALAEYLKKRRRN